MSAAGTDVKGRLVIAKMVLENFKSYGGVKVLGPFHKKFSAVVGPNGSGKSNVIDAMQFVMGKRASKMRLKKVSELIHRSENLPNCEYAKVSVHFQDIVDTGDGDDDYEVVEGSQVVVTRVAYATNGSKYFLDDRSSSYTEVTDLLKARGIDLDNNRSMVLQGEIEQIAMMKPKGVNPGDSGLLEFLEDIIGSNKYVDAIADAGKVTEEANEERTSHLHRVKIVEKERLALESSKAEAEAYMAKEQELCTKRFTLYQLNRAQTETQAASLRERADAAAAEYAELDAALVAAAKVLKATEAKFGAVQAEHGQVARALADAKREFEAYERKDVKYRADVKHCKAKIKKNAKAGVAAAAGVDAAVAALARAEDDAAAAAADVAKHSADVATLDAKLEELNTALAAVTSEFQAEIEEAQKAAMPHVEAKAAHQAALDLASSEAALISSKVDKAGAALAAAQGELDTYRSSRAAHAAKLEAKKGELADAEAREAQVAADLTEAGTLEAGLAHDVRTLRSQVEESRTALHAATSRSTVLDELLKLKAAGKLPGIYGRLGDLGTIDGAYDVAISTAAPALNNIVVDSAETGSKAVAYLRKHKLGRATFVILDQLQYLAKYMAVDADSFPAPRLFDLITPGAPELAPAFFYATKNTLVVDSLDAASAVAFDGARRFRVVTTDGKLIDASGTMSGGGSRVASGLMNTAADAVAAAAAAPSGSDSAPVTPADVAAAEAELETKMMELGAVRAEMESLKRAKYKLSSTVAKLRTAVTKLEMDSAAAAASEPVLVAKIESYAAAANLSDTDAARLAELEAAVATESAALAEASVIVDAFDSEIKVLQEKILEAGGMELRKAKSSRESAAKHADMAETAQTKAQVAIKSATKAVTKAKAALAASEAEAADLTAALATMETEFATLESEAVAVLRSYKQTQELMDAKADELAALRDTYEDQKTSHAALQSREVDLATRRDDLARTVADYDRRVAEWTAKMAAVEKQWRDSVAFAAGPAAAPAAPPPPAPARMVESDNDESDAESDAASDAGQSSGSDDGPRLRELSSRKLEKVNKAELEAEIGLLEQVIEELAPNLRAIQQYREKEEEYLAKVALLDEVTSRRDAARDAYDALRKERLDMFMAGFSAITLKLRAIYQLITFGGDAELEFVDTLAPIEEGVLFSVRPPKKAWRSISHLSGGEKTLASLALIFALQQYRPTPLFVFDEIDAALDHANVAVVASYIAERAAGAQFIVISLRSESFSLANRLTGVYKTEDSTKTVTIDPNALALGRGVIA